MLTEDTCYFERKFMPEPDFLHMLQTWKMPMSISILGVNKKAALASLCYPQIIIQIQPIYISWLLVRRAFTPWQRYSANITLHDVTT